MNGERERKEGVRERGGRGKGEGRENVPLALILQLDHCK